MLRSMTAYGRSHITNEVGHFTLEIQSVNRKFLEINIHLPKELSFLDTFIRKSLQKELHCGQVNVTIKASFEQASLYDVRPNIALAKAIYQAWEKIKDSLGLTQNFDLKLLADDPDIFVYSENAALETQCEQILESLVSEALSRFIAMREEEGKALKTDFLARLEILENNMKSIQEHSHDAPERFRQKILQRIQELLPNAVENEERLIREVIIYAEKVDIQEEITRFYSHISQFKTLLEGKNEGVGKNLDFLSQELARELNTLGAKTPDLSCSKLIIEMKTELARIREQIQNVE